MSIYVRVGAETICVSGPGGDAGKFASSEPIPVEVLEREVAGSRRRQGLRAPPCPDLVAFAEGQVRGDEAEAVRVHVDGCAACRGLLVEVAVRSGHLSDVGARRAAAGTVVLTPLAGEFVELKPRRRVEAVLWTGQNWPDVEAWLSGRVESAKLDPDDASVVLVVDDDDGDSTWCRSGSWFVCDGRGGVSTLSAERFAKLYAPAPSSPAETVASPHADATGRLADWSRWARDLLVEPDDGAGDDVLRKKISAVLEAPAALEQAVDGAGDSAATVEACARVANDVYAVGAEGDMARWDVASVGQRQDARSAARAVLSGGTARQWHAAWFAERVASGWTYGPVRDDERKTHPSVRPYDELPPDQRLLDDLFVAAVLAARDALLWLGAERAPIVLKSAGDLLPEEFEALAPRGASGSRDLRQRLVMTWAADCFGSDAAAHGSQRAVRMLEEAAELAQACGVAPELASRVLSHVYGRPPGEVPQEVGGVSIALLALAEAFGLSAESEECREFGRIMMRPREHFAERDRQKNAAGLKAMDP